MAQGSRPARVGDLIREELSVLLRRDVRDPGLTHVTLTHVQMSSDLQHARVLYTVPSESVSRRDFARAFHRSRPYLRHQLAQRLQLRHVPELAFEYDDSAERQDRIAQLLEEISVEAEEK